MGRPSKDVDIDEIPMPEGFDTPDESLVVTKPPVAATKVPEIATLDFIDEGVETLPIKHAFRLNGVVVKSLSLRRLTIGQVQKLTEKSRQEDGLDYISIYAEIAGIDEAVARGLKDEDGDALADRCQDFLPRAFRGETQSE